MKTILTVAAAIVCLASGAQAGCRGGILYVSFPNKTTIAVNGKVLHSQRELFEQFKKAAAAAEQPEVHLEPNPAVEYKTVQKVLEAAGQAGLHCVGFTGLDQPGAD